MSSVSETQETLELKDASKNPWYVLMTVAGEQSSDGRDFDEELHARNRRYFNGWMASTLSADAKITLIASERCTAEDLEPLTEAEQSDIAAAFSTRCPQAAPIDTMNPKINLAGNEVKGKLICIGYLFSGVAYFQDATFSEYAYFQDATFSGDTDFHNAIFSGNANFSGETFHRPVTFEKANFYQRVDFTDRQFKAPTNFAECRFHGEPPRYFNADLHEDTRWKGIKVWPVPKGEYAADEADYFIRSYERLKLLMAG